MVSVETLDTAPTAVILSLSAVAFDQTGIGKTFHRVISMESCQQHGLTVGERSLQWWLEQPAEVRQAAFTGGVSLEQALAEFELAFDWNGLQVWDSGELAALMTVANAFKAIGYKPPWQSWNMRGFNTLRSIVPAPVFCAISEHCGGFSQDKHGVEAAAVYAQTVRNITNYLENCYGASESTARRA